MAAGERTGENVDVTPLTAVVAGLALYRLTRLITADAITEPLRDRAPGWMSPMLGCPWCLSMWLAPPVAASVLWLSDGWGWWLAAGSLAGSAVAGLLSAYDGG